jgi:hypothetical protein
MTAKREKKHNLYTYRGFQTVVANNAAVLNFLLETFTNKPSNKDNETLEESDFRHRILYGSTI